MTSNFKPTMMSLLLANFGAVATTQIINNNSWSYEAALTNSKNKQNAKAKKNPAKTNKFWRRPKREANFNFVWFQFIQYLNAMWIQL